MIRDHDIWHHRSYRNLHQTLLLELTIGFLNTAFGGKELHYHENPEMYQGYRIVGFEASFFVELMDAKDVVLDVERKRFDVSFYYGFTWM